MPPTIETRAVLAAAYLRRRASTYLTHAVVVAPDGADVRVLCGRVQLDSLADAGATDPHAAPTCARCQRGLTKYMYSCDNG